MSLVFSASLCQKYMCLSSCSHYLPFEVQVYVGISDCETYTSMYCDTMDLVGKVHGQGLARDHGLVPDHGLVLEISGYLFKSVIFS